MTSKSVLGQSKTLFWTEKLHQKITFIPQNHCIGPILIQQIFYTVHKRESPLLDQENWIKREIYYQNLSKENAHPGCKDGIASPEKVGRPRKINPKEEVDRDQIAKTNIEKYHD